MQYSLVGSRFVLQYKLYCEPGWACVTIQHGLGSWGAGVGAGAQAWALGPRAGAQAPGGCVGRWARARAGREGIGWRQAQACRQARGRWSEWQAGREAAGAQGTQQARGHAMDARGRAAGAGKGARAGRLGGLCASGVRSWAKLGVLVHLTQFLAWFDLLFFPSHQMNTVHFKINFFEIFFF